MDRNLFSKKNLMRIICHQKPERSFYIFGKKFFLCTRCTGLYFGFLIFLILFFLFNWFQQISILKLTIIFLITITPLLIDGLTQLFYLRESNNSLRFLTGILAGFGIALIFAYIIRRLTEIFINLLL